MAKKEEQNKDKVQELEEKVTSLDTELQITLATNERLQVRIGKLEGYIARLETERQALIEHAKKGE